MSPLDVLINAFTPSESMQTLKTRARSSGRHPAVGIPLGMYDMLKSVLHHFRVQERKSDLGASRSDRGQQSIGMIAH